MNQPNTSNPCGRSVGALAAKRAAHGVLVFLLGALCLTTVYSAPAAFGATAGHAQVVKPGTTTPLDTGDSVTEFGLLLPDGARCPGDSTKPPYYQAASYLVPKGIDPASVNFKADLPSPGYFLRALGAPWVAMNVELGTGVVHLPPSFDLEDFTTALVLPRGVSSATWEGGVACADHAGVASNYWNFEVTFSASPSHPGGFVWKVVQSGRAQSSRSRSHWPMVAGVAAIGALSVALVWKLGQSSGRRSTEMPAGPSSSRRSEQPVGVDRRP